MIDPVIITLFGIEIYWYGVVYALGFYLSWLFIRKNHIQLGISKDTCDTIILLVMIFGLFGGRIFHIIFYQLEYYLANPIDIIRFDKGGMSIHGGLLGGFLAIVYLSRKYHFSMLKLTDLVILPLSLVLAFGRIANFINQELVGRVTNSFIGVVFPRVDDQNRFPSQLFESIKNMLVFQILLYLHYFKSLKPGILTALFLILYNGLRFLVNFTRTADVSLGIISMGQFLSLLGMLLGCVMLWYLIKKKDYSSKNELNKKGSQVSKK